MHVISKGRESEISFSFLLPHVLLFAIPVLREPQTLVCNGSLEAITSLDPHRGILEEVGAFFSSTGNCFLFFCFSSTCGTGAKDLAPHRLPPPKSLPTP